MNGVGGLIATVQPGIVRSDPLGGQLQRLARRDIGEHLRPGGGCELARDMAMGQGRGFDRPFSHLIARRDQRNWGDPHDRAAALAVIAGRLAKTAAGT